MAKAKPYPTYERLHYLFECTDGGGLFWKNPTFPRHKGLPVGTHLTCNGYYRVMIGRRPLMLHRVLWKMWHNSEPPIIDHINGDKSDNRKMNLREAPGNGNWRNCKPRGGSSKFKGVYLDRYGKKWGSRIKVNGKTIHLGTFESEEDAAREYDKASRKYHGEFSSTNEQFGLYSK